MKRSILAVALVVCAGAGVAVATDYNDVGTGGWSSDATWDQPGWPDTPGDTATIDSDTVRMDVTTDAGVSITLAGGNMQLWEDNVTCQGSINVSAPSAFLGGSDFAGDKLTLSGTLTGSSLLTVDSGARYLSVSSPSSTFSGGWQVNSGRLKATGDKALGSGAITVNGGWLVFTVPQTYAVSPAIQINAGATVDVSGTSTGNLALGVNGGSYYLRYGNTFSGTVNVGAAGMTFIGAGDYCDDVHTWSGSVLSGSGQITVDTSCRTIKIDGAHGGFSGTWQIDSGSLVINSANAFGTNLAAPVVSRATAGYGGRGGLTFMTIDNASTPPITLDGGQVCNMVNRATNTLSVPVTLTANGGTLFGVGWTPYGTGQSNEYSGTITLGGDLTANAAGSDIYISGVLTGAGNVTKTGSRTLYLSNVGTTFTGGVEVQQGTVQVDAAGALGNGTATATGGTIRSAATDAFASAAQIVAEENGTVELNSLEDNAKLHIKPGGGFVVSGGGTTLVYTPVTGNVQVEAGCILDENLGNMGGFPDIGDFLLGDEGYGAFVAAISGDWNVGSGSETIYRGLAATSGSPTFSGTVTESLGGTEGIGMLATGPATFTYSGATFTTQGTNTIKFYGAGGHVIGAGNNFNNNLERFGTGMIQVAGTAGITGKTLTMKGGWLDIDAGDALSGAVVELVAAAGNEPGGVFRVDQDVTVGTVNVRTGGAVQLWGSSFQIQTDLAQGTTTWNFEPGSQLVFGTTYWKSTEPPDPIILRGDVTPAQGKADFLFLGTDYRGLGLSPSRLPPFNNSTLTMGEGRRITITGVPGVMYSHRVGAGSDKVVLDTDVTSMRLCGPTGVTLAMAAQLDLTGSGTAAGTVGKLSVGASTYHAARIDGQGFMDIGQDGTVALENTANVIGSIDIQAGTLQVSDPACLGGASPINVGGGTTLLRPGDQWSTLSLAATVTGTGTVQVGTQTPRGTLVMQPTCVLSPGSSAGIMTVDGSVQFNSVETEPGVYDYAQLDVDVTGPNAGAGSDYDQLIVSGDVTNLINGELVVNIDAGLTQGDLAGDVLTILTCANDLTSPPQEFGSVVWTAGWAGTVTYGVGVIELSDIGIGLPPPGDATGEGCVDGADYTAWADHYGQTGLPAYSDGGWTVGNWNEDQEVDGADYTAWADNYGTGCDSTVPEPVTLSLLALAACLPLLRRRR